MQTRLFVLTVVLACGVPVAEAQLSSSQQLVVACHRLDIDAVVRLLRSGADVNARFENSETRKHFQDPWSGGWPGHAGEWTPLHALANSSKYPKPRKPFRNTLEHLDWARKTQQSISNSVIEKRDQIRVAILRVLLSHGCDIDVQDSWGATTLYDALCRRHEGMVTLLLQFKPNVDTKTGVYIDGTPDITPLHRASWSPELTRLLLDLGADDTATDGMGRTPADWRAQSEGDGSGFGG